MGAIARFAWLTPALAVLAIALSAPCAGAAARPYDFDGDGLQDLAAGMPFDGPAAGAVLVVRGSRTRLLARRATVLRPHAARPDWDVSTFGSALASADFDRDGHADLAIGRVASLPGEAGTARVTVAYGSRHGLARTVELDGPAWPFGGIEFGAALAAADLDRDGYGDLVVGAPDDDPGGDGDFTGGALYVFRGSPAGLQTAAPSRIARPFVDLNRFGGELAVGDVNGDRYPDVLEGDQGETDVTDFGAWPGHVSFCPGGPGGPQACRLFSGGPHLDVFEADPPPPGGTGPTSLAVADVTGDGFADVVAGVPQAGYTNGDGRIHSEVRLWRGSPAGPAGAPVRMRPGRRGVPGSRHWRTLFGAAVAAADVDRDGFADILVGTPFQGDGRVTVLFGGRHGPRRGRTLVVERRSLALRDRRLRRYGWFGAAMTVLDHDGDHRPDLSVGTTGELGAGLVLTLPGRRHGLDLAHPHPVRLRSLGIRVPRTPDNGEAGSQFGDVLGGAASGEWTVLDG